MATTRPKSKTKVKPGKEIKMVTTQKDNNARAGKSVAKSRRRPTKIDDESVNIVSKLCDSIWWEYSASLARNVKGGDVVSASANNFDLFDGESKRAAILFSKQEALFNARNTKDKDAKWLSTMMRNGTMSDRVSASTLAVQQNPVFSIKVMMPLVTMAMKNNQREAQLAITALKDLFVNNLMPSDRKLKYLAQQPLFDPSVSAKNLILWHYEDKLKSIFAKLVDALEKASGNKLKFFKIFAMNATKELLSAMPEQEVRLLGILVNKVGDPERGVAAKAGFLLTRLLEEHPRMKGVVVAEVTQMLYRPNICNRSKYYGVVFLNQIALRQGDSALARKLVELYFTLFEQTVKDRVGNKQSQSMAPSRFLSAILTGVNRTCPYVGSGADSGVASMLDDRVNTLFKLIHVGAFMTSTQALALLFQFTDVGNASFVDRLYQALYKKIVSADFRNARKPTTLLNVVFRAMKRDDQPRRVMAFARRLLQTAAQCANVPLCTSLLYLVHSALSTRSDVGKELLSSESVAKVVEAAASAKAIDSPGVRAPTIKPVSSKEAVEADGDGDVAAEADGDGAADGDGDGAADADGDGAAEADGAKPSPPEPSDRPLWYDMATRNPKYAVPTATRLWETPLFLSHYHPSVRRFAESLQQAKRTSGKKGEKAVTINGPEYQGDPMRDFTLMSFLDRFSYRNPKKPREQSVEGKAAMQPRQYRSDRAMQDPVNSKSFLMQNPKHVAADEQFFYNFFVEKAKREARENAKLGKSKKQQSVSDLLGNEGDVGDSRLDGSDGEEQFATMLAEKMMADHARSTGGIDFDPDDDFNPFSEDEDEGIDVGGDSDGEDDDGAADTQDASVFATANDFAIMLENPNEKGKDFEAIRNQQRQFKRKYHKDAAEAKKNKNKRARKNKKAKSKRKRK